MATDEDERSVLEEAIGREATDLVQALLLGGADPNDKTADGTPLIVFAAGVAESEEVRLLLEHGADPNAPDEHGWTALHAAADYIDWDMAEELLEHGARTDALWNGDSPIDLARQEESSYGRPYVYRTDKDPERNESSRRIHDEIERKYHEGKSARSVSSFVEFLETWAERK